MIRFTLRKPFLLLNPLLRMHRAQRKKHQMALALEIDAATIGAKPPTPFQRARVTIERFSTGVPDQDGLYGGAKLLLDCLTTPRRTGSTVRNPLGLGFVVDDSPEHIDLTVCASRASRADSRTVVTIEEIPLAAARPASGLSSVAQETNHVQ